MKGGLFASLRVHFDPLLGIPPADIFMQNQEPKSLEELAGSGCIRLLVFLRDSVTARTSHGGESSHWGLLQHLLPFAGSTTIMNHNCTQILGYRQAVSVLYSTSQTELQNSMQVVTQCFYF